MKANTNNDVVLHGAEEWKERESHEKVMEELSHVKGKINSYFYINGYYKYWDITELPEGRAEEIAKRGRTDEIIYMIQQYGRTRITDEDGKCLPGYDPSHKNCAVLSDEVQEIILQRKCLDEIKTYVHYHGFASKGQDIILDEWSHDEIMWYLNHHGFDAAHQQRLLKRGNADEINLHIARHGLCNEILNEMFDKMAMDGRLDAFYAYINSHELPVPAQKRMVLMVKSPEFQAYVSHYGLWNEVHQLMVEQRSEDDVAFYIKRHRFLDNDGEGALAKRNSNRLHMIYIENRVGQPRSLRMFLDHLLLIRPLDYAALSACFLKLNYDRILSNEEKNLLEHGSHEEIMAKAKDKNFVLSAKGLAYLFFRNNPEEFETYLDQRKSYFIYY